MFPTYSGPQRFLAQDDINGIRSIYGVRSQTNTGTPVYAIKPDGDMLFYKHTGFNDGSPNWPITAKKIGNGWNFKQVFAGDNGAVYGIQDNGDMLFYKHAGFNDGSPSWPIQAKKIGNGWNFKQVFAGGN